MDQTLPKINIGKNLGYLQCEPIVVFIEN